MTSTPPPPPPYGAPPLGGPLPSANGSGAQLSPVAWLVPLAALLALIGVFTPWFKPQGHATATDGSTHSGDVVKDALYSFKEGRLGLIAPVVLVVVAIGVVQVLTGRRGRFHRSSRGPARSAAVGSIVAGAVAAVALVIAYFTLPVFYKFKLPDGTSKSWDDTEKLLRSQDGIRDFTISQGPQVGFWLTAAAAALALAAGVVMLVTAGKAGVPAGTSSYGPSAQPFGQQPAPQYGQPQYGQPQYGQPQYGQPEYGQPQGAFPPPAPAPQGPGYPPPAYGQPPAYSTPPAAQPPAYGPPQQVGAPPQQVGQPQQSGQPQPPAAPEAAPAAAAPATASPDENDADKTRVYGRLPEGYRPPPPAGSGPQG